MIKSIESLQSYSSEYMLMCVCLSGPRVVCVLQFWPLIFVCLCYVVLRKFPSEHSPVPERAFCTQIRHGAPDGRTF